MATITQMRKVFLYRTEHFWYIVPVELTDRFLTLMNRYYTTKAEEDRIAFLNTFGDYKLKEEHLQTQDFYVKEQGIFHKTNDPK